MVDYIKEHYDFPLTRKSANKPLRGLRVIDASVMPTVTRANTNLTTIMLAERMADRMQ